MSSTFNGSARPSDASANGSGGSRIIEFDATARRKERMRAQAAGELMHHFGFTVDNVKSVVEDVLP